MHFQAFKLSIRSPQAHTLTTSNSFRLIRYRPPKCTKMSHNRRYCPKQEPYKIVPGEIEERVAHTKQFLDSMEDGRISISPYDTAWVALVENNQEIMKTPQFPSCLKWIAENQLPDGSWGDADFFSSYDRLLNTLACVVALKTWNIHHHLAQKGISFINDNIYKLELECAEHMTNGFEVVFPSLVEKAESMGYKILDNFPIIREIFAERQLKLKKIPKEILHSKHTTLLFSLEGLQGLEWEKLLKLQSPDGSFLTSTSSTAFALMNTGNRKCLNFLTQVVEKFDGGVPHSYPIDIFAGTWAVDRLQRLGISRHFQTEIIKILCRVYRCWMESPERGLFSARNTPLADLDDTSMVFRLLRLHGYSISSDVFQNFKYGDVFQCFPLQTSESVTAIFSLYRASQVRFRGEKILEEAYEFSYKHLSEISHSKNQLNDKWVILKDLPGEVGLALDLPWYAILPRVEARFYIEQYGGNDEIWIGKTLFRMYEVSNNNYLKLAKLDFNACQAQHQMEWNDIQKWYLESNLKEHGISKEDVQFAYFVAAASLFEPERSNERMSWTKSAILADIITLYMNREETSCNQKIAFMNEFRSYQKILNYDKRYNHETGNKGSVVDTLAKTIKQLSSETLRKNGREICEHLYKAWETWLMNVNEGGNSKLGELLVQIISFSTSHSISETTLTHPQYKRLSYLANKVCDQLHVYSIINKMHDTDIRSRGSRKHLLAEIEPDMQELVEVVLQKSLDGIDSNVKELFLIVVKSFYYSAYSSPETISLHIRKVLFEELV